jgi:hypothetical protein
MNLEKRSQAPTGNELSELLGAGAKCGEFSGNGAEVKGVSRILRNKANKPGELSRIQKVWVLRHCDASR